MGLHLAALLVSLAASSASASSTTSAYLTRPVRPALAPLLSAALRLRGGVQELASLEEWTAIRDAEERLVVLDVSATTNPPFLTQVRFFHTC